MKPLIIFNPSNICIENNVTYKYRTATRGVVFDNDGKVAALFKDEKYYSLPGGGVLDNEYLNIAFERECFEELGCNISNCTQEGVTMEYLEGGINLTSIFSSIIKGEKMDVKLIGDEDEDEKLCIVKWVDFNELKDIIFDLTINGKEDNKFRFNRDLAIMEMCNKNI